MTNSKHFLTAAQERRYRHRFLTLCLESIRQSGQCSYPPLLQLIEQYEADATASHSPLQGVNVYDLKRKAIDSHGLIIGAAQYLQNLRTWNYSPQIQQAIQVIAKESKTLEMLLRPLYPPDAQEAEVLKRLHCLRDYLLQKLSDTHFLSPQGLRAEQPMIFLQQHRRVYKYLGQLRAVTDELIEMLCHLIETSQGN